MKPSPQAIAVLTTLIAATTALAIPTGAHWENIENCFNPVTGEFTGLNGIYSTYDLYVDLEPGDSITIAASGDGQNDGISLVGSTFFQSDPPFGSDSFVRNLSLAAFDVTLPFDTAAALGDEELSFAGINWDPAGIVGAWFSQTAGNAVAGPSVHIARVTVQNGFSALHGEIFVSGTGPNGDFGQQDVSTGVVHVPNAGIGGVFHDCVPTPGAPSLLAIASLAALRRRR